MTNPSNRMVFSPTDVLQALQAGPLSARNLARSSNGKVLARFKNTVLLPMLAAGEIKRVPYGGSRCWALADWVETDLMYVQRMQAECVRSDGCLIWRGHVTRCGVPTVSRGGKTGLSLRRLVFEAYSGRAISPKFFVQMTCGNDCCLEMGHMRRISRSRLMSGVPKSVLHRIHCAESARNKPGALGLAVAEQIRSSDLSNAQLARELGCNHSTVHAIRTGRLYKTYTNPFGSLGGA